MANKSKTGTTWLAVTLVAVGMAGLGGCAPANGFPRVSEVLSTPRETEDALPGSTADWGLDQDSSRLVGTVDHVDYFVGASTDPDSGQESACVIMVDTATDAGVAGCSPNEGGMHTYGMGVGSARISADTVTYPESAGWVQLAGFLLVNPSASSAD